MTIFLRLLSDTDKSQALLEAVSKKDSRFFDLDPKVFEEIPGSPFAYWVSSSLRRLYKIFPLIEVGERTAKIGPSTGDDPRYIRCFWEVLLPDSDSGINWPAFAKGGVYSRFYADIHLVIHWDPRRKTFRGFIGRPGRETERPNGLEFFFKPGLTWPLRTNGLSFRAIPTGCVFGHKGPVVFIKNENVSDLFALSAVMNSVVFGYLVSMQVARTELAQSYEVGLIQHTPVPELDKPTTQSLAKFANRAWSLKRTLDTINETSHAFLLPATLRLRQGEFDPSNIDKELEKIKTEIDDYTFRLYGLDGPDRTEIVVWAAKGKSKPLVEVEESGKETREEDEGVSASDNEALFSWCVGVSFGRFDIRLATGVRIAPPEPEPFDPLPVKSPGMLPDGVAPFGTVRGILVDDAGHGDDLAGVVQSVLEQVKIPIPENLRFWLAKEFFPFHIKLYSKSRRKAPIYWQLATPSASYSVWIYIHAFNKDTLYRIQNDYATPKLRHEERKLESMRSEVGADPKSEARKALAEQESFVDELRTFLEEIKRVAPLWNPNLDDGVVINFAPLWRLVPQHKTWQKELKSTWDSLCEGEYDWSHLAMHLWPERVVSKCADDRSLAIAHDLEAVFWIEGTDGKWKKREANKSTISALVQEKTSPSVKASLQSLMDAPLSGSAARGRKAKASL